MPDDSTNFQSRYHVLQQQFCTDLPARLEHILAAGRNWLATETQATPGGDFLVSVHNLAGSAGSFGFPEITTLCQQIEDAIRKNDPTAREAIPSLLESLGTFVKVPK